MGEVYEANDLSLGEHVAIKVIREHLLWQRGVVERFKQEVKVAKQVTHPNVCRIHEYFEDSREHSEGTEEILFLSMELLRGRTLADRLKEGGFLTVNQAWPLVKQMASALDAIHAIGVVHRDLKPGNIMLVRAKELGSVRAVVMDFGIARRATTSADKQPMTTRGEVLGTPEYMSPEQREGQLATAASDIYALGLVIREMVTGMRPLESGTLASTESRPGLPARWEAVIRRSLERDPSRRFKTAEDVARALAGEGSALSTSVRRARGITIQLRHVLASVALLALVGTIVYMFFRNSHSNVSDASIAVAMQARFNQDPVLFKDTVDITVESGVVTLRGTVGSEGERAAAENIAKGCYGVKSVLDKLIVRTQTGGGPETIMKPKGTKAGGHQKESTSATNLTDVTSPRSSVLPPSWISLDVMEAAGNAVYVGGRSADGGTLGVYQTRNGKFSDLSHLLPASWCPVRSLAFGDDQLFVGGGSRGGCAALFSPASQVLQDLSSELHSHGPGLYYYGGIQALGFNGREFLVGGAGKVTSLETYAPTTGRFTYLSMPYFAVNSITSYGNSFLLAGAGPGSGPSQPPALGWISPDHLFTNLTSFLPPGWGVTAHSAQDGKEFLIEGRNRATGEKLFAVFDPANRSSTDVTESFPESFDLHSVDGRQGYFLLGGQADGVCYLARYHPGAQPSVVRGLLPPDAIDVTAVKTVGNQSIVAGLTRARRVFIISFPEKTSK
jgi:serine/threonine protein kinase